MNTYKVCEDQLINEGFEAVTLHSQISHFTSLNEEAYVVHMGIGKGYAVYKYDKRVLETPVHEIIETAILNKFGIKCKSNVNHEGVSITCKSVQSAFTLLNSFKRYEVLVKADDYMNFSVFIPVKNYKELL